MLHYMGVLASMSGRVQITNYGKTHQRRPLVHLTISSAQNLADLDQILAANRELADPSTSDARAAEIMESNPAIAWLSYNVHGNEALGDGDRDPGGVHDGRVDQRRGGVDPGQAGAGHRPLPEP